MRKKLLKFLTALLVFSSFSITTVATEIYILHTNDIHGRVLEGKYDGMGLARISSIVNDARNSYENVLLLDAGDTFHGMPIVTLEKGASILKIMNAIGYDAMVPGNHDFNYSKDRLLELADMADFPILAANIMVKEKEDYFLPPHTTWEMDGVTIGVFGLATPETLYKSHPDGTKGLEFVSPIEAAQKMVDELRDEVDILIALSHLGMDESSDYENTSIGVAESVSGIDLIVDAHSHHKLSEGKIVNDTLIVMAGEYDKNLGVVRIDVSEDGSKTLSAGLIEKEYALENSEPDKVIEKLVNEIKETQDEILSEVVGTTKVKLDGERAQVRAGETNLGNVITDSMVEVTGADFAFTNGGGIRSSIDVGGITKGEIIKVLPFGNQIVTKKIVGSDVKLALEVASSAYPETAGNFAHVSGLTYKIDPSKPAGSRVRDIKIKDKPLKMDEYYIMATNDFLAAGGDGMTMFVEAEDVSESIALDEALIKHIKEKGEIAPKIEGRIQAVPSGIRYTVISGDSLSEIAEKYDVKWIELAEYNEIENPDLIIIGQEIVIPGR